MPAQGAVTLFITGIGGIQNVGASAETGIAMLETKALDFGKVEYSKFLQRIVTHIRDREENSTLRVEVYGSDDEELNFELLDTIYLSEEDPGWTDPPGMKYYKFKFVDEFVTTRWALHGLVLWGDIGGEEF